MENRIHHLFHRKEKNILSVFLTAGYPGIDDAPKLIKFLQSSGVDMVEVGFPFSDPLADGPVIQQSSFKAIENGMHLQLLFSQLKQIKEEVTIPILLMGYLNPVYQFGKENFVRSCVDSGVDGVIIPDMPLSYYKENYQGIFTENNISNVLLIAPETSESRIHEIDQITDGFVYVVSSNSITGSLNGVDASLSYFEKVGRMHLKNPTLVGFGINNKHTFNQACTYSNGAIIGSAFIKHINKEGVSESSVNKFVNSIIT